MDTTCIKARTAGGPAGRASSASTGPYASGDGAGGFFEDDQPLLAYAERLGLPLAYVTSIDLDLNQHVADGARATVSEAHDEYWSVRMRPLSPVRVTAA